MTPMQSYANAKCIHSGPLLPVPDLGIGSVTPCWCCHMGMNCRFHQPSESPKLGVEHQASDLRIDGASAEVRGHCVAGASFARGGSCATPIKSCK